MITYMLAGRDTPEVCVWQRKATGCVVRHVRVLATGRG